MSVYGTIGVRISEGWRWIEFFDEKFILTPPKNHPFMEYCSEFKVAFVSEGNHYFRKGIYYYPSYIFLQRSE